MSTEVEEWRPVVGWEGLYSVSDWARVRSEARVVLRGNGAPLPLQERILKATTNVHGYPVVNLCGHGKPKPRQVHHLVLEAFRGPRPEGYEACHNDSDSTNARLENLRWDTPKGNNADRMRRGTAAHVLTADDVRAIRASPLNAYQVGRVYGVSSTTIYAVRARRTWPHID